MPTRDQFFNAHYEWHEEYRKECQDLSKTACFKAMQIEILKINQLCVRSQMDQVHLDDMLMHTIKARILSEVYEEKMEQSQNVQSLVMK